MKDVIAEKGETGLEKEKMASISTYWCPLASVEPLLAKKAARSKKFERLLEQPFMSAESPFQAGHQIT